MQEREEALREWNFIVSKWKIFKPPEKALKEHERSQGWYYTPTTFG